MSTIVYGIITAPGQSSSFFDFKKKHFSRSNKTPYIMNSELANDFEVNIIHRFEDSIETEPSEGVTTLTSVDVMDLVDMVITKSKNKNFSLDVDVTTAEFETTFPGWEIEFTGIITDAEGLVWPKLITLVGDSETVVLYLYPNYFETNYPNTNVTVVTLIDNLDEFETMSTAAIKSAVANLDTMVFSDEFAAITEDQPPTKILVDSHTWVNSNELSETVDIPFGVVCYGEPSVEVREAAIRDHIIANSTMGATVREVVFPSLFGSEGYTLFPFWGNIARVDDRNIYSPACSVEDMIAFAAEVTSTITTTFAGINYTVIPTVFQSLSLLCIPEDNPLAPIGKFEENIKDYFLAATTSGDFTGMSTDTQSFVKTLFEVLDIAETYPEANTIDDYEIEVVDDITYITFFSNGYKWRVVTKAIYDALA